VMGGEKGRLHRGSIKGIASNHIQVFLANRARGGKRWGGQGLGGCLILDGGKVLRWFADCDGEKGVVFKLARASMWRSDVRGSDRRGVGIQEEGGQRSPYRVSVQLDLELKCALSTRGYGLEKNVHRAPRDSPGHTLLQWEDGG